MIDEHQRRGVSPVKRPRSRRHLVHHDAEREDVDRGSSGRASICSGDMYGPCPRMVPVSVNCMTRRVVSRSRLPARGARQAEVENLHASVVRHHHVAGLQVAVGDLLLMRGRERFGERVARRRTSPSTLRPRESPGRASGPRRAPSSGSGWEPALSRRRSVLRGKDRDDVRVIERGEGPRFAGEAGQAIGIAGHRSGRTLRATSRPRRGSWAR